MSEDHLNQFDITLVVKDGKEFQSHRNVLSQASPFFEKLLSTDMKENNEGVIRLEWITESQMADILQFIYTGNVQISSQENAENLFATADYLLFSNLKTIAGKFLEQHMTTENCISIYYSVAEKYSCEELIASTRKFINSNFTAVAASNDFLNLPSHEVEKWISSDEIVIDAEENVFEIIHRWIDFNESERSVKFGELFRHVRLTTISRDFLIKDIVTNDLVKESSACLDTVTAALNWIDRSTDCDVPRPHSPRNSLKTSVIVIADFFHGVYPCFYLPATDEWYCLPAIEGQPYVEHIVSCRGKVFVVIEDIATTQCYDPDLNRWSPAPWTKVEPSLPFATKPLWQVLVVKDQICFIVAEVGSAALCTYNFDTSSLKPLLNWVEKRCFCAVAVDRYIYVIGGTILGRSALYPPLSECSRFDTEAEEWQNIAPLNEARIGAFGVCKNEKIFIAGGHWEDRFSQVIFMNSCEVYNILTDEWQLIANLKLNRNLGSMVLVDDVLFVLGGRTTDRYHSGPKWSDTVECYDHEKDEWNNKANVPASKMTIEKREEWDKKANIPVSIEGCSLQVFTGVLNNLVSIDRDYMVLVDDVLFVLGGRTTFHCEGGSKLSDIVECYDHEKDEWYDKAIIPVSMMTIEKRKKLGYFFKGCSLQVFTGVLNSLESIDRD
ncbi:kelch-like protein 21 [Oculina patagonica]